MAATPRSGALPAAPRPGLHRRILSIAALFGAAVVVAVVATGSTYAFWNDTVPTNAATVATGATGLTVNGVTNYTVPGLNATSLLPGRSVVSPTPLLIRNAGSTPLLVSVSTITYPDAPSTSLSSHLNIVLRQGTTCSTSPDGAAAATMTGPVNFAVGQTISFCLEVGLKATAPASVQGTTAQFTINLNGAQVRP